MANYWNQALLFWRDINGNTCTSFVTLQDQSDAVPGEILSLVAAAQAISSAKIVAVQLQTTHVIAGDPVTGPYQTVADRAIFGTRFSASSQASRLEIPAPTGAIFLADNKTVDMTNVNVIAWVNEVLSVVGNRNGSAVVTVKTGTRQRVNVGP